MKVIFHFVKNFFDKPRLRRFRSKKKKKEKVFVKSIMAALILHTRTMERVMLIRTYCHVKNWKYKDMALKNWWMEKKRM